MWFKVAVLLLYLLVLFAVSRLLEMSVVLSWAVNLESAGLACFSTALVHPVSLSVREIKKILDARGVSYVGLAEKRELTDLVESSGRLMESELDEVMTEDTEDTDVHVVAEGAPSEQVDASTTQFTCGSHFYEEVEDSKDSIWLVLVVPPQTTAAANDEHRAGIHNSHPPLLDHEQWRQLVARVKPFGIRTGILNCHLDRRLCKKKGWHGHQIVLALPKGIHPKDSVVLHSYRGRVPASAISVFSWVRKRLSSRLAIVDTEKELQRFWLNFTDSHVETKVRVLLSTTTAPAMPLEDPPLAYSALSMKFSGRVSFGLVDRKVIEESPPLSAVHVSDPASISRLVYVVITPEGIGVYGDRPGEHLTYKSMELYFRTLQPEMNDVFTLSLIVTNILACLDFFAIRRKLWRQLVHCSWTLTKYNVLLFSFWIAVFGLNHLDFMRITSDFFLGVSRYLASSDHLGCLRHHYRFWKSCPKALFASFLALWFAYGGVRKRLLQDGGESNNINAGGSSSLQTSMFHNFASYLFSRPRINVADAADLEEGLTLWIERLATPNLWLYPLIPYDYIKDLPTWRFRRNKSTKPDQALERLNGGSSEVTTTTTSEDDHERLEIINVSGDDQSPSSSSTTIVDSRPPRQPPPAWPSRIFSAIGQRLLDWTMGKKRARKSTRGRCTRAPADTKEATECAVCLEFYVHGVLLCGLPCGHNFHQKCIVGWLSRDHHNCPICRRPSYGHWRTTNRIELAVESRAE